VSWLTCDKKVPGGSHDEGTPRFLSRRRRSRAHGVSFAVNIAPMIDVTFLLLIFFLVTTTFERAEGLLKSEMPHEGEGMSVALPLTPIVVRLDVASEAEGGVYMRVDRVPTVPEDFEDLTTILRQMQDHPGFDQDTPVVIVSDDAVRWDYVVETWNAAVRAGCTHIAFGDR